MKLYIPSSSLNADSILSCECVTPACECKKRAFGYSHFETLEELKKYDYCTLAFSKIPLFSIEDSARENYPMIIEIDIASPSSIGLSLLGSFETTDVYTTANPIVVSPSNTRLLFYKMKHLEYTYHNCSDSAKCKLFDFFKYNFHSVGTIEQGHTLSEILRNISIPKVSSSYSENDYDRVKGFIWGYALGYLFSPTPETAQLLKIQKRIYDIVSSCKSDGYVPDALRLELENLDNEYSLYDPIQNSAKLKWNEKIKALPNIIPELSDVITTSLVEKLLHEFGVETEAKNKFLTCQNITLRKPLRAYHATSSYVQYNQELVLHTRSAVTRDNNEKLHNISLQNHLHVDVRSFKTVTLLTDDDNSILFNKIIHRIIWNNLIPSLEEIRVNRKDVAVSVVKTLKSIIEESGQQWQNSDLQAYFDRMRKNISKYEPFELKDISNPILQSVAAFVLKGEDYESLKSYLETNAIAEYQYALALWGSMIGYVSIPRSLFEGLSRSIVVSLYNQIEIILNGIDLSLSAHQTESYIEDTNVLQVDTQPYQLNFRQDVLSHFHNVVKKNKKNKDKLEEGLRLALDKFGDDKDPLRFVRILNSSFKSYGWGETLKPWKQMCEYICQDYSTLTQGQNTRINQFHKRELPYLHGFESENLHKEQLYDSEELKKDIRNLSFGIERDNLEIKSKLLSPNTKYSAYKKSLLSPGILEGLIHSQFPNLHKQIFKDIRWFVENYANKYKDEKSGEIRYCKYANYSKDNQSVLDSLTQYLHRNTRNNCKWIKDIYSTVPIDQILNFLRSIYKN